MGAEEIKSLGEAIMSTVGVITEQLGEEPDDDNTTAALMAAVTGMCSCLALIFDLSVYAQEQDDPVATGDNAAVMIRVVMDNMLKQMAGGEGLDDHSQRVIAACRASLNGPLSDDAIKLMEEDDEDAD